MSFIDPDSTQPEYQRHEGETTFVTSAAGVQHKFLPGDIIDGAYQLRRPLGAGGMGVVFACTHLVMARDYAIKILSDDQMSGEYWARFKSEAQALAKLNHQSIVSIYNMGIAGGQFPYYVMELLEGETLDVVLSKKKRLPATDVLEIFIQLADGLSSAHSRGIIHRDVKPSNIMLDKKNKIKIVDFGIARVSQQNFASQSQTKTGTIFGTPFYMSPEQCQGSKADERSDIYSLGCTLFECLIGKPPFCGANNFETFMFHQSEPVPSFSSVAPQVDFPFGLEAAVTKMLAKDKSARYQSMAQVKHDLERIQAGKSIMPGGTTTNVPAVPSGPAPYLKSETIARRETNTNTEIPALPNQPSGRFEYRNREAENQARDYAGQSTARLNRSWQQSEYSSSPERDNDHEEYGSKVVSPRGFVLVATIGVILCAGLAGGLWWLFNHSSATNNDHAAHYKFNPDETFDIKEVKTFETIKKEEPILRKRLIKYKSDPFLATSQIKQSSPPGFRFPSDFIVGAIKIANAAPQLAYGFISCPVDSRAVLILTKQTEHWPEFLYKFGPSDLNGLELRTDRPLAVLEIAGKWRKLDEICFFNSLLKAVPDSEHNRPKDRDNEATTDESAISNNTLPEVDKLTHLKTLGLCSVRVTGSAIVKMRLFKTISCLKLKRVSDVQTVLDALPERDNIEELWLVAQDITDAQLEPLTRMKNLQTLRIRRSKLSPKSLDYLVKMPALKHLILDKAWLPDDAERFKKAFPFFEYEGMTDATFWQMLPR